VWDPRVGLCSFFFFTFSPAPHRTAPRRTRKHE
jgi:hypothetical protein